MNVSSSRSVTTDGSPPEPSSTRTLTRDHLSTGTGTARGVGAPSAPPPTPSLLTPSAGWSSPSAREPRDLHEAIEAFKQPFRRVTEIVISREPLAEAAALAVATHEHLLVHSKPGKAKSQFARALFSRLEGSVYEKGFTDGTLEEEVVGGLEADKFREGIVHRRTEGTLVTADWAFLDEFTRAQRGTWDLMLGILNEGMFRNGTEIEHAHLHTAVAAANFLIATDRFLAVRDRFVYQAVLADEDSRYAALRIDQVHARPAPPVLDSERLPLAVPRRLAAIVLGTDPQYHVELPYALSFLKDDVIRRAVRAAAQRSARGETVDDRLAYVSSRTVAKAADAMKASALLNHRFAVTKDDLPAVRFAVTTIAGDGRAVQSGERVFVHALQEALAYYSEDDLHQVEEIMHIDDVYEEIHQGRKFEFRSLNQGIRNRVLSLLRHSTWEDVTVETCAEALTRIKTAKPEVETLRHDILDHIRHHR